MFLWTPLHKFSSVFKLFNNPSSISACLFSFITHRNENSDLDNACAISLSLFLFQLNNAPKGYVYNRGRGLCVKPIHANIIGFDDISGNGGVRI
ncbi:hypothetical protein LIER_18441 [Lithospermum erythrorhizon]|uniref:Uncharacterized protein n=1 Tax=Lithospermum erythrorhizon TaxID=34254 RepID=A0AAV3QE03_LITER